LDSRADVLSVAKILRRLVRRWEGGAEEEEEEERRAEDGGGGREEGLSRC